MAATGVRISELVKFQVEDVLDGFKDIYSKGNKMRRVYIPITNPEATLTFYWICHQNHFDKIKKVQAHINEVDWIHYRNEDFEII